MKRTALTVIALATLSGCCDREDVRLAVADISEIYRVEYERLLAQRGTRGYAVSTRQAFVAMHRALEALGMTLQASDGDAGYLRASAPAPTPLDTNEWQRVSDAELPRMQLIVTNRAGVAGWFVKFEPDGVEVVIDVTTTARDGGGVDVAVAMRMNEIEGAKSGCPRRGYPPPTGLEIGLEKFWSTFERELASALRID